MAAEVLGIDPKITGKMLEAMKAEKLTEPPKPVAGGAGGAA
jgi:hypothetical protein